MNTEDIEARLEIELTRREIEHARKETIRLTKIAEKAAEVAERQRVEWRELTAKLQRLHRGEK